MHLRKELPPLPPPADEDFARMEAIVRTKLASGDRLTPEERQFLAHLPDRDVRYR